MSTQRVRNILIVLILVLSVGLVPTVRAEIVIEPNGVTQDLEVVIEPDLVTPNLEIVIELAGVCREIVIEPNGITTPSI